MINTALLEKTLNILDNVITTMEKHPQTYPAADVDGIRLGRSLLQRGHDIFIKYDDATRQALVDLIAQNELWFVDQVYLKKKADKYFSQQRISIYLTMFPDFTLLEIVLSI